MRTIEVVAAIIRKEGRILATQRGYGEYAGGWEFPGGKVESGESAEEAIIREIEEELGVAIQVDRFVTTVEWDYPSFHLVMHCFLAHVPQGDLRLLEHSDAVWVDAATVDDIDWLPADILVVEAIKEQGIL